MKLTVDNRSASDMLAYLEARVDALRERVRELEQENGQLRAELHFERYNNALDEAVRG
jgi:phage shock protein A